MAYEWAKPGARCVCINPIDELVEGATYTVSKLGNRFSPTHLELVEHGRRSWFISRFRPLITKTKEEDVALFQSLLSPNLVDKLDLLAERMNDERD